jgi:magnesium-transporting ATPase (P-type)
MILSGSSLVEIEKTEALKNKFLTLMDLCDVVVACRVSPKQKADLVRIVK